MAVRGKSESCLLTVRVQPRASKSEIAGLMADGTLRVRLKSPPTGGRANKELVGLLARVFGVSADAVRIVGGVTSRRKRVVIEGAKSSHVKGLLNGKPEKKN